MKTSTSTLPALLWMGGPWLAGAILFAFAVTGLRAADEATGKVVSCNEFLTPKFEIRGKQLGQEQCKMTETDFTYLGKKFRRMDMGISGTVDGYAPKVGRYNHYLSSN